MKRTIEELELQNFEGVSKTIHLGRLNAIIGPVGSWKSAVSNAVRFAALGYLPRIGKTEAATSRLVSSGEREMTVSVKCQDGSWVQGIKVGSEISRTGASTWLQSGATSRSVQQQVRLMFGENQEVAEQNLDISLLVSAPPGARAQAINDLIGSGVVDHELHKKLIRSAIIIRWVAPNSFSRIMEGSDESIIRSTPEELMSPHDLASIDAFLTSLDTVAKGKWGWADIIQSANGEKNFANRRARECSSSLQDLEKRAASQVREDPTAASISVQEAFDRTSRATTNLTECQFRLNKFMGYLVDLEKAREDLLKLAEDEADRKDDAPTKEDVIAFVQSAVHQRITHGSWEAAPVIAALDSLREAYTRYTLAPSRPPEIVRPSRSALQVIIEDLSDRIPSDPSAAKKNLEQEVAYALADVEKAKALYAEVSGREALKNQILAIGADVAKYQSMAKIATVVESVSKELRNRYIAGKVEPLINVMRKFFSGASIAVDPYIDFDGSACEFGWATNGRRVSVETLSGGETVLFMSALALAVLSVRNPEISCLMVEAAELGNGRHFKALLDGLSVAGEHISNIIVSTCVSGVDSMIDSKWVVHNTGGSNA